MPLGCWKSLTAQFRVTSVMNALQSGAVTSSEASAGCPCAGHRGAVAVAGPRPGDQGVLAVGPSGARRRRDVAVRVEVLGIVVGARLERCRAPDAALRHNVPFAPVRVDRRVRVAGQDVRDDVGGLWRNHLRARRGLVREARQAGALGVLDVQDRRTSDVVAAVGHRGVRGRKIDRVHLQRPERHRQPGASAGRCSGRSGRTPSRCRRRAGSRSGRAS